MANEKRLIYANAFIRDARFLMGGFATDTYWQGYGDALDRIEELIMQYPTVDAIPVDQIQVHFSKVYLLAGECVLEAAICGAPLVVRIPCSQDVVEVVRCRDCKHWRGDHPEWFQEQGWGSCVECLMDTKDDFFCQYGERRDNE